MKPPFTRSQSAVRHLGSPDSFTCAIFTDSGNTFLASVAGSTTADAEIKADKAGQPMGATTQAMRPAYLLTKPNGSTALLFNAQRARGLAHYYGWTLKPLSGPEAAAHIRKSLSR